MRNPWNFIIPTLKVSVTKVQGFFDLRECNFQTSFHIGCSWSKIMKIRGDKNAKSLNFIIPTLKVSITKVQGFFDLREFNFQTSFHFGCSWNKMMKIRGDQNAKSLKLTNFKSFNNKSSGIFRFERVQISNLFSHWVQLKQNDENKRWPKLEILETLLYQL